MFSQKYLDQFGNTPLHRAILTANVREASELISADYISPRKLCTINVRALDNTPLLLALKTGNFTIAEMLLSHPYIDIDATDNSGMNALHYAALFRDENLIKQLLEKKAEVDIISERIAQKYQRYKNLFSGLSANHFYQMTFLPLKNIIVPTRIFEHSELILPAYTYLICQNYFALIPNFFNTAAKSIKPKTRDLLCNALLHLPLHNLAFHFDALCTNTNYFICDQFIPSFTLESGDACTETFRNNFILGYEGFIKYRNNLPINATILRALESASNQPQPFI